MKDHVIRTPNLNYIKSKYKILVERSIKAPALFLSDSFFSTVL